ncbi:hypothetical protein Paes_0080 [Prosthecochloris aestuarii DSM 271]|uniref:Uncharacterized protein n=1 Tax=Prosthecochloris aestuarii (strain DSM 271 / SK 413) TaxID=290512 RepID=B4S346_PROA2|nr:hypothetical protein [Prosthecochloris aestuarii]ACF45140.1 hypothetical protein Paes_0080 [Prosthecochloris aestuarii DSM 271]
MSHNDNDKIRDSSTVSNPPLSNVLFEALGRIIFDREKIVFGGFNIGCPLTRKTDSIDLSFSEVYTENNKVEPPKE